jgi:hypothetical protein
MPIFVYSLALWLLANCLLVGCMLKLGSRRHGSTNLANPSAQHVPRVYRAWRANDPGADRGGAGNP